MESQSAVGKSNSKSQRESIGLGKTIIIAFQHLLVMVPGTIAVPLILASVLGLDAETTAFLVSANFFTSGITTLIQVVGLGKNIGSRLPIVLGSSFATLGPMIVIGQNYGLPMIFGSVIASGIIVFLLTFVMDKVLPLFPKVVVGSFVTLIGITLAPSAIRDLAGGAGSTQFGSIANLALGFGVLITILLLQRFGKGLVNALSMLIGIIGGTIVGYFLGLVDFAPVAEAKLISVVTPFKFGPPEFALLPIILMTIFSVINIIQCIGVFSVLDEVVGTDTNQTTKIRGIRGQSVGQMISGIFGSIPSTMFNENISLLGITKVKNPSVIITASIMMILLGIFPKVSAIITMVPSSVIGGVTLILFGIITASGISMLASLDFFKDNNFTIVGTSLAIGVGANFASEIFAQLPETLEMMLSNGLFMVSVSAILLNLLFNGKKSLQNQTEK